MQGWIKIEFPDLSSILRRALEVMISIRSNAVIAHSPDLLNVIELDVRG